MSILNALDPGRSLEASVGHAMIAQKITSEVNFNRPYIEDWVRTDRVNRIKQNQADTLLSSRNASQNTLLASPPSSFDHNSEKLTAVTFEILSRDAMDVKSNFRNSHTPP